MLKILKYQSKKLQQDFTSAEHKNVLNSRLFTLHHSIYNFK